METNNRTIENFNELIFENRHKAYGAYALRKSQNDHVTKALFITLLFFGILVLSAISFNKGKDKKPDTSGNLPIIDSLFSVPIDLTPKEEKIKIESEKKVEKAVPKTDVLNFKVDDKAVQPDIKPNEELKIVAGGNEKGVDSTGHNEIPNTFNTGKQETTEEPPTYGPDVFPEFYGNMYKFILDHIRYPQIAKENGTQGTVGLSFIVERDGTVSNIKSLNDIGDGCTEEAIRVLKLMPKWKPGENKGKPVRVFYTIPVKFRLSTD